MDAVYRMDMGDALLADERDGDRGHANDLAGDDRVAKSGPPLAKVSSEGGSLRGPGGKAPDAEVDGGIRVAHSSGRVAKGRA